MKIDNLTVKNIKQMIKKYNDTFEIKKYYRMRKADLIKVIKEHPKINLVEGEKVSIEIKKPKRKVMFKGGRFITPKQIN